MKAGAVLAGLLEALSGQIRAAGKEEDYCSITVQPGNAVAFDFGPESGCNGSAWVRLVGTTLSPDEGGKNCGRWRIYTIEMGMIGPAPKMEDRMGTFVLPEDTELFDAAMRQSDEMDMMFAALESAGVGDLTIGDYLPQGPEGGVLGGTWTVTVDEL
jgi:hypothetical protein